MGMTCRPSARRPAKPPPVTTARTPLLPCRSCLCLGSEGEEGGRRVIDARRSPLHLERPLPPVVALHDRVDLVALVVAVVVHRPVEGFGRHAQLANDQRLERGAQVAGDWANTWNG